jgi:biofilm PGA synthesis N-glycosyltransferase PgaC
LINFENHHKKFYHLEFIILYSIFTFFCICFLIQAYFLIVVQGKFARIKAPETIHDFRPNLSVVICARNEAKNLQENLNFILEQDYPNYEVIVVNDCSYDNSEEILKEFVNQFPAKLKVVTITEHPRHKTSKKFAATLGIKATANDFLIFTDADCKPKSVHWLSSMVNHYKNPQTEIVLGFSPYQSKPGFLNKIIRYETCLTAINYFGFSLTGMPYMGIGRNLSYKKSLFFKGKGFASHLHIPSGDDDLFVNQHANPNNVAIEFSADAQVISEPNTTFKNFWRQKFRHLGAGKAYKRSHKAILTTQFLSGLLFYDLFILLIVLKFQLIWVVGVFLLRFFIQTLVYFKALRKLKSVDLLGSLIILDPVYHFYMILLTIFASFKRKNQWK